MSENNHSEFRLVFVLVAIATVAATLLAVCRAMTADAIAEAIRLETLSAVKITLPPFANEPDKETIVLETKEGQVNCFPAKDASGNLVGIAVPGIDHDAYGGDMELMVGILPDGKVNGVKALVLKETPGLGSPVDDEKFLKQFKGKTLQGEFKWSVKKDGGSVDALSGATISSRAATRAISNALERYEEAKKKVGKE